jgi:hypothetical protein
MDFWDRHPRWFIFGVSVLVVAAIFALPIVIYCVVCQAIFIAAIFVLDIILPSAIGIVGFDLGTGFLSTGIGAAIGFFLLLGRWTIDIIQIKWIYIVANIIFFLVSIQVAIQEYGSNVHSFFNFFPNHPNFSSWLLWSALGFLTAGVVIGAGVWCEINERRSESIKPKASHVAATNIVQPTAPSPVPPSQTPSSPARVEPILDRAAWYKQLARENAQQTRR